MKNNTLTRFEFGTSLPLQLIGGHFTNLIIETFDIIHTYN